jgi:hypothetical protein
MTLFLWVILVAAVVINNKMYQKIIVLGGVWRGAANRRGDCFTISNQ